MPGWDFKCDDCKVIEERWFRSFNEMEKEAHLCPKCDQPMTRLPPSGSFILKGHGFHAHDYKPVIDNRNQPK